MRCHGDTCPYGYGHHAEHVVNARKSWVTRRAGVDRLSSRDARYLQHYTGRISSLHHHKTRNGTRHVFRMHGHYFSMSDDEYKKAVAWGHGKEVYEKAHKDLLEKEEQQKLRARKKQEKQDAKTREKHEREHKRAADREEKYRRSQERLAAGVKREERRQVNSLIRGLGGIARYGTAGNKGREHEREEYNRAVPKYLRARKQSRTSGHKEGFHIDQVAEQVAYHMPQTGIRDANDLREYLEYGKVRNT